MDTDIHLLKIKNLHVKYLSSDGAIPILKNISFSVLQGKTLGITGESGSGKSMTALSLIGLTRDLDSIHVTGDIFFEKSNVTQFTEEEWNRTRGKRISIIFQQPQAALNPLIHCGRQISEAIKIHNPLLTNKELDIKTIDLLMQVGLTETKRIIKSFPHELSGGQLQRIAIAIAIANNPDVIIADEPTSSLDTRTSKEIVKLLKSLQIKHKSTLIFITHDIRLLKEISDQIILINEGEIEANILNDGKSDTILSEYAKRYLELTHSPLVFRPTISDGDAIVLAVHSVCKTYRQTGFFSFFSSHQTYVLTDIQFVLKKGRMLGVLGESGSGKTTLGKIISGILDPTQGSIFYNGKSISKFDFNTDKKLRKNIQLIFQDSYSSFNPKQTVGQLLEEVITFYKLASSPDERKKKLNDILQQLKLEKSNILNLFVHQLSGGQRQRIALARTLLLQPEVIIFDESLTALDYMNQKNILELIIKLQNEFNFCGIFITHDPYLVKTLCTEVLIMDQGKIVEQGLVEEIYNHPRHAVTKSLIYSGNELK